MNSKPSREELEKQIRFHEGQSAWNMWTLRVETLERLVEQMESWGENDDIRATVKNIHTVASELRQARDAARKRLESLAAFAPRPKGRKRG